MKETEESRITPRFAYQRSRGIMGGESDFLEETTRSVLDLKFEMNIRYLREDSE